LAVLACVSGPLVDADPVVAEAAVEAPVCAVAVPTAGWLVDVVAASPASRSLPRPARVLLGNIERSPTTSTATAARVSSTHQAGRRDAAFPSLEGTSSAVGSGGVLAGNAVAGVTVCEFREVAVTVAVAPGAMDGLGVGSGCCAEAPARPVACAPRIGIGAVEAVCNVDVRSGPVAWRDPDETLRPAVSAAKSRAVGATVCRLRSAAEPSFALLAPRLIPATRRTGRACPAAARCLTPATRGIGRAFFGNSPPV
jgi:hypothetical protein